MKDKNIIKDFGNITVPTCWEEVTLKMFQDIERYYEDKDKKFDTREVLHIFTGKSIDEINELPLEFLDIIGTHLLFLQTPMKEQTPTNKIEINGETYMVHFENQLKVGEYIAADSVLKEDKHNYAAILAILCRKDGEIYDSHFENEIMENRIKLFEQQPVTKIMPIIGFFIQCYMTSVLPTLLSSKVEEAINLTRKNIETSHQNGEISKRSMKSLMKKLKKLEKSIKCI